LNRSRPNARPNRVIEMIGATSESSGLDGERMIGQLQQAVGRIAESTIGAETGRLFMYPLEWDGEIRAMAYIVWTGSELARQFLADTREQCDELFGVAQMVARFRDADRLPVPDPYGMERWTRRLGPVLSRQGLPIVRFRTESSGGGRVLVGVCGVQMQGARFFACHEDTALRAELRRIDHVFLMVAVMLLGAGSAAGLVLRRTLLRPIAALADGIAAIERRHFAVRLPASGDDELGRLVGAFNGMLEGLADLEVGRAVAESLFPHEVLRVGEAAIYGRSEAASRMGGDWFDYRATGPHSMLVSIGDVTGHGTGPALVVAMAKAMMTLLADLRAPGAMLAVLYRSMYNVLQKRYFMTLLLAEIDLATRTVTLANAGHNCPVLVRGSQVEMLEAIGFPIGAMRMVQPRTVKIAIEPGDVLLFHTDGLVESRLAGTDRQVGYDRLTAQVQSLIGATPRETVENVGRWHRGLVGPGAFDDDVTVMAWHWDGAGSPDTAGVTAVSRRV